VSRLAVRSGAWQPGMSYLCVGSGDPLLFLPGLSAHHGPPRGLDRLGQIGQLRVLARTRQVWWVNRRAGLPADVTMAAMARDYALGIRRWFQDPVDLLGVSTGGSVGLQLALDHPELVRRLVLVSSGCRLGPEGRRAQRAMATRLAKGDPRGAGQEMLGFLGTRPLGREVGSVLGWLLGPVMFRDGASDMCATIKAEDVFDLTDRLSGVRVPTLVVGGERDVPYGPGIFRETAQGMPNGRLLLYGGTGHMGVQAKRRFAADVLGFLSSTTKQRVPDSPPEKRGQR